MGLDVVRALVLVRRFQVRVLAGLLVGLDVRLAVAGRVTTLLELALLLGHSFLLVGVPHRCGMSTARRAWALKSSHRILEITTPPVRLRPWGSCGSAWESRWARCAASSRTRISAVPSSR